MADHETETRSSVPYLLGQLTAKVDLLLSNQQSYDKRHDELEQRVSVLEKDKAKILGAVLVVSTVIGFAANYFL